MNRFERGFKAVFGIQTPEAEKEKPVTNILSMASGQIAQVAGYMTAEERSSMRLSAVNRCVEVLSDSIGKLPVYVIDTNTKKRVDNHPLMRILTVRPNNIQTPLEFKKYMEGSRLCGGNGYAFILRDPSSGIPLQLIPIPHGRMNIRVVKQTGELKYTFQDPWTDRPYQNISACDVIHVRAYSYNGYQGVSVLERAAEVIGTGRASQEYALNYYANGGQPSGVLETDTDLGGTVEVSNADGTTTTQSRKDIIRNEWSKRYNGPANAGTVAVLDMGLKYTPIAINNRDAQFIEQAELSIQDIARFFGVPLYKLGAGKQSYSSNEQNAVEYVTGTLHPIVAQYEQELTYKLLTESEIRKGLEIKINMEAELRGDTGSRGAYYRNMRELGVYSVNDIRDLEDLPEVEGGDGRYASLNYVPLNDWQKLSQERAAGKGGINQ